MIGSANAKGAWGQWIAGLSSFGEGPAGAVYKEWERFFAGHLEKLTQSEQFTGRISQAVALSGALRKAVEGMVSARDERIATLERRIEALEAEIRTLRGG